MAEIILKPIGIIRSPNTDPSKTPIQPIYAEGIKGYAEIYPEFEEGLKDIEGFSHIFLIFYFHKTSQEKLKVIPYLESVERGVFATRSPSHPNKIGISLVELLKIEGSVLHLNRVDILDGTHLLDIKPYISRFDKVENSRNGWQDKIDEEKAKTLGSRKK
ncbi:MAG: tRNA (N6-threonylcarbamoyladenosine(37)-N6)-methyltransferase TrmO [Thermoanaerobaculaceae bacterium]|nr:tRNA (N6-threonylcarbamoyladenosine(37)-N6)-methyltransferase TrmO [Thermoanaerobaculaceae bacterium]